MHGKGHHLRPTLTDDLRVSYWATLLSRRKIAECIILRKRLPCPIIQSQYIGPNLMRKHGVSVLSLPYASWGSWSWRHLRGDRVSACWRISYNYFVGQHMSGPRTFSPTTSGTCIRPFRNPVITRFLTKATVTVVIRIIFRSTTKIISTGGATDMCRKSRKDHRIRSWIRLWIRINHGSEWNHGSGSDQGNLKQSVDLAIP
jgi:hypothetical protein